VSVLETDANKKKPVITINVDNLVLAGTFVMAFTAIAFVVKFLFF
jgi:hypothetical protein